MDVEAPQRPVRSGSAEALEEAGSVFQRQRGSHMILRRAEPPARVTVPDHKVVRVGTLRHILHEAGLSVGEFLQLLGRGR